MGRHKEWRKIAKRERRRRIRIKEAKSRYIDMLCNSSEYQKWLDEQEELELFELEQIGKTNLLENEKWIKAERAAMMQWKTLQEQKEKLRLQHLEEEAKRKLEWDLEQATKRKEEERLKEVEEENRRKQEVFMNHLENFLSGDSIEPPEELLVSRETKPDCDPCPFFAKTACCRFGDQCSRNHRYPGISQVLLATNFFSHFGLEKADEHDADIMLEYEDSDTYKELKEFFNDVLPEFEKFGRIIQFKICNNYEKHLRGNTYVEFAELRCAVAAYRALHARWYGGKQLSLQFCLISSWKNAICGLQSRKRCPKGRACNFLHVFRNPNNMFNSTRESYDNSDRSHRSPLRSWRWSESPEVEVVRRRSRSTDRRYRKRIERDRRENELRRRRDKRERSRREERRRENSSCEEDEDYRTETKKRAYSSDKRKNLNFQTQHRDKDMHRERDDYRKSSGKEDNKHKSRKEKRSKER